MTKIEFGNPTLNVPDDHPLCNAQVYSITDDMIFAYWNNEDMSFYFRQSPDELRVKLNTLASILFLEIPEDLNCENILSVVNHLRTEAEKRKEHTISELCKEWRKRA